MNKSTPGNEVLLPGVRLYCWKHVCRGGSVVVKERVLWPLGRGGRGSNRAPPLECRGGWVRTPSGKGEGFEPPRDPHGARTAADSPRLPPRRPTSAPDAATCPQEAPKGSQEAPKKLPRRPHEADVLQTLKGSSRFLPSRLFAVDGLLGSQGRPQEASRGFHDASENLPGGPTYPQRPPWRPEEIPDASKCPTRPNLDALPSIFRRGSRFSDSPVTTLNLEAPLGHPAPHERKVMLARETFPPVPWTSGLHAMPTHSVFGSESTRT